MVAVLINLIIFGTIGACIIIPLWLRSQERIKVQETIRAAIESGQAMPTDVLEDAAKNINVRIPPMPSASRDLRTGIIWLGLGAGFAAMGVALGFDWPDATMPILACAAFPLFIGLAFVALALIGRSKDRA